MTAIFTLQKFAFDISNLDSNFLFVITKTNKTKTAILGTITKSTTIGKSVFKISIIKMLSIHLNHH
ncbi:MAG: hypothetical protein FWF58_03775, partial [Firmicutes bacterium]|nr:hypothetical protein [Bacillota bacterium]